MRLDGFGIFVKDMGRMIRFYRDVLGFEIALYVDSSSVFASIFFAHLIHFLFTRRMQYIPPGTYPAKYFSISRNKNII